MPPARCPRGGSDRPCERPEELGLQVEVHPEATGLGKQLRHAANLGARFAAILGANEVACGAVTLKDLATGEQRALPQGDVVRAIRG